MKRLALGLSLALSATAAIAQSPVIYLNCIVTSPEGKPDRVFDFTLSEAQGTVTYFVREANAMNVEKAYFGADKVVWSTNAQYMSSRRSIDRLTLAYSEVVAVVDKPREEKGTCKIVPPPVGRKF